MPNPENLLPPMKPGETRNPNGRPKGRNFATVINEFLDLKLPKNTDLSTIYEQFPELEKRKINMRDLISIRLIDDCIKDGNIQKINTLLDRADGKASQVVTHQGITPIVVANEKDKAALEETYNV